MPTKQKFTLRWDSSTMDMADFNHTLTQARNTYPAPTVKMALAIKGSIPAEHIEEIMAIAQEFGCEMTISLSGEWLKEERAQMRLGL